jgi:hypothetical protein
VEFVPPLTVINLQLVHTWRMIIDIIMLFVSSGRLQQAGLSAAELRCLQTFKIMERGRRAFIRLCVWSNEMKPWVQTVSVRMWPSVCDRNVCRLFIKFCIADLFARNCEAILTLVPTGPATVTICLGQKKRFTLLSVFLDRVGWNSVPTATQSHWAFMSFVKILLCRRTWSYVYIAVPCIRMIFWK